MPPARAPDGWAAAGVLISFLLALTLRILPLPPGLFALNPDWLALLILFWTLREPQRVGVIGAWGLGLLADVLTGRLLGQHGLAYAVMAYLNLRLRPAVAPLPLPAQSLWVLLLSLLGQWLILGTQRIELAASARASYWLPSLGAALAWPLLAWLLPGPRGGGRMP